MNPETVIQFADGRVYLLFDAAQPEAYADLCKAVRRQHKAKGGPVIARRPTSSDNILDPRSGLPLTAAENAA